jgi:hypothetical protein
VKSGSVTLNGAQVLDDKDFSASLLRALVNVQPNNTVVADLKGDVGDFIVLAIRRVLDESVCAPHVFFDEPSESATVPGPTLLVRGTATGAHDLGITVNGFPAEVDSSHAGTAQDAFHWFAQIEIEAPTSTIEAVAKTPSGATGTASRRITVVAPENPVTIRALPPNGLVPLNATFYISVAAPAKISNCEIDFDGDGIYETSFARLPEDELRHAFAEPGIHIVTLRTTDTNGGSTTTKTAINAETLASMDALLKRSWSRFLEALSSGDVDRSLSELVDEPTRERYRPALDLIRPTLSRFAAGLQTIRPVSIGANSAHYLLTRTEAGEVVGYHIYFARDEKGVWRVAQF